MWDFWESLTDAQAALLSTLIIVVAGAIGVLFSVVVFGKRVRNLEEALSATEKKIGAVLESSAQNVERYNQQLTEKLGIVDEQFSATLDALGQLRNSVAGLQDAADRNADTLRDQLRTHWSSIAEQIEEIASNPSIHGKTRARYSKIPRRSLDALLTALIEDGRIEASKMRDYRDAVAHWNYFKNGRATLTPADIEKMKEFALRLVPSYRPT